ncbi:hypothetical protein MCOR07_010193 [Pyricularia oryzae]|nr:hypothetical protein MCOR07_010193 [Pyricularia oryzae]
MSSSKDSLERAGPGAKKKPPPPVRPKPSLSSMISRLVKEWTAKDDPERYFCERIWPTVRHDYAMLACCARETIIAALANHPRKPNVVLPIEDRTKEAGSISKSIHRRKVQLQGPGPIFREIHDLVGLRVIVSRPKDVGQLKELILTHFDVKLVSPFLRDRAAGDGSQDPTEFGEYEAWNYRVHLKPTANNKRFQDVLFEIQLVTWADAMFNILCHPLLYKQSAGELSVEERRLVDLYHGNVRQLSVLMDGLRNPLQLAQMAEGTEEHVSSPRDLLERARELAVRQQATTQDGSGLGTLPDFQDMVNTMRNLQVQLGLDMSSKRHEMFLKSLKFPGMNERRNIIEESHEETFRWALNDVGAASDESNSESDDSNSELDDWQDKESHQDWSEKELRSLVKTVIESEPSPICVFIDGLDEVPVQQKLWEQVRMLAEFDKASVKLCVSSRPELRFENVLREYPRLRLQDLTHDDLQTFVKTALVDELYTKFASESSPAVEEFANCLLEKAAGVFLWIKLVTASLKRGLDNGDSLEFLEKRLIELPGDIIELYKEMWLRLDEDTKQYRQDGARYINCVLNSMILEREAHIDLYTVGMPLIVLEAAVNPGFRDKVLSRKAATGEGVTEQELAEIATKVQTRCAGLVELVETKRDYYFGDKGFFLELRSITSARIIHRSAAELEQRVLTIIDPYLDELWCFRLEKEAKISSGDEGDEEEFEEDVPYKEYGEGEEGFEGLKAAFGLLQRAFDDGSGDEKHVERLEIDIYEYLAQRQCGYAFEREIDMSDMEQRSPQMRTEWHENEAMERPDLYFPAGLTRTCAERWGWALSASTVQRF